MSAGEAEETLSGSYGYQVGSGSCCSTVSPFSTAGFSGNIGDVVYDSEKKRVIVKIYD